MQVRFLVRLLAGLSLCAGLARPAAAQILAPEPNLKSGCGWVLTYDPAMPETGNSAFPEMAARYWVAIISDTVPVGSRVRIDGRYPNARYSAFHIHDGNLLYHDALSDNEITPNPGSVNRNLDRTRRDNNLPFGGSYTAYARLKVNVGDSGVREPNTIYRREPTLLDGKAKKRSLLTYRTYLAEGGNQGGVELPKLTLQTPDGKSQVLPDPADAAACATLKNRLLTPSGSSLPISLVKPLIPERKPVFRKSNTEFLETLDLGVGYNPHNAFTSTKGDRSYGDFLLVRGRLPTYTTQTVLGPVPQVRYWSFCQNGINSTMVYGCLSDREVAVDAFGYYTIALSTDLSRPAALSAARGFSWLNWGPERISGMLIRELLARDDFAQSITAAPSSPAAFAEARGEYMPVATYCSRAVINQFAAQGAALTFAACNN